MTRFKKHSWWMVTVLMTAAIIVHAQSANFTAGTPISAAAVNARFTAIETGLVTMTLDLSEASNPTWGTFAFNCITGINAQAGTFPANPDPNGREFMPIGCSLAAQRKCGASGFRYGYFVGEGGGSSRVIVCIK